MAKVLPITTRFLDISSIYRLDAFTKSLSKDDYEELFVQDATESILAYKGLSRKLSQFRPRVTSKGVSE